MAAPKATDEPDEPEMIPVPDISVLDEDQKWSLFLWCGGTYLDRIDHQGVDTINYLQILQWVNRVYKDVEKVHGSVVFTVKYADPIAWRTHIPLNSDWDVLDMFIAHRWKKHICIHATFDTSFPIQYYDPKKLFKPLLGQRGLPEVVEKYFPGSEQRRCAWHLFNNFRSKFSGVLLAKYFWKASRAYNETDYLDAMKVIKETDLGAYIWLLKLNPKFWSRHAFGKDSKSDHVTNNHTESFNGWLGELREKNIVKLNDGIRHKLMVRIYKRFVLSEKWDGVLTKNIAKKLKKNVEEGRKCVIAAASRSEYEVLDLYKRSWVVNLDKKYCSCGTWGLTGLPCRHAVTCITYARKPMMDFVDSCYTKVTFQRANGDYIIHPIEDQAFWGPGTGRTPAPPEVKRGRGRPQNIRRRDKNLEPNPTPQRSSGVVQCSKCKGYGHNARTCGRVHPERMTPEERQVFESTRPATSRSAATRPPATAQPTRKRSKKNDGISSTQTQPQSQQVRRSKRNAGRADGSCSQP